ncbi:malate dehydrogenase (oxaloacetate-decarboxylating)(NADP+) [Anaerolineae bacterium]|nr:malate dehydrogenase (oxaloacetate-decarboxylating)(NADP+) [Anaerolineae bacterium]
MAVSKQEVLDYHRLGRPGKIEVIATKPSLTQRDLSLAYSPGVAEATLEVERDPETAYELTAKGNLVAVVSNGTAILGLGDRGPLASKPVMEGKGLLFKRFADIDVFDIEINARTPAEIIAVVKALEPTFGGINLEDIKAPECFEVEEKCKAQMNIPVFHDDQHGTAIISGAGLLNALEISGKKIDQIRVVISGAGASAVACGEFWIRLGVKREHVTMVDTKGVVYKGRVEGMNPYKARFAQDTNARTLAQAVKGADVFLGLSVKDLLTQDMVKTMGPKPLIFALANPDPEITYDAAKAACPDAIVGTGRSDFPNQINNVLGFPFIFRGALDVRAKAINEEMKVAAARALASLAKQDVPDSVLKAYGLEALHFGPEYIVPKPVDPRVLLWEAPAVAQAAMESGVARKKIDLAQYREQLEARMGKGREVMRTVINKAKSNPKRIVFGEGEEPKVIRAAAQIAEDGIGKPILLGRREVIELRVKELNLEYKPEIVTPQRDAKAPGAERYVSAYLKLRERKGITRGMAERQMSRRNHLGPMMVKLGDADAFVSGLTFNYPDVIRPALQIVHTKEGVKKAAGMYIVITKDQRIFFFTDATVNIDPSSEDLAEIAILAADAAKNFDIEPRVAMLSFSNFGGTEHPLADKVRRAIDLVRAKRPDLPIDGEMQADTAVVPEILEERYPFAKVRNPNVLVFPNLESANVAYKLLRRLGGAETIGPILLGMGKPIHVIQQGDEVKDIVNIAALAVVDAQRQ